MNTEIKRLAFATLFKAASRGLLLALVIVLSAGQCRPPHNPDDMVVAAEIEWADFCLADTLGNNILGSALPLDSWWTDGHIYYKVKRTGKTIRLEGMTLHEGGFVVTLSADGDSLHVSSSHLADENLFGEDGSLVRWHRICYDALGEKMESAVELLVAYSKDDDSEPAFVLQRFDGNELQFELDGIHALLAGTYKGADGTLWTFLSDGTMTMKEGEQPKAYSVERFYHSLTNVVCLPNKQRVALELTSSGQLNVLQADFDKSEGEWQQTEPRKQLMQLTKQTDDSWYFDKPFWGNQRLFTLAMSHFLEGSVDDQLNDYYYDLSGSRYLFGQLNANILYRMSNSLTNH